jgi:hypothetical protein
MNKDKLMEFDYDKWGWFDTNNGNRRLPAEDLGKWFRFTGGKTRYLNAGRAEIVYDMNPQLTIPTRQPIPQGYCPTHGKRAVYTQEEYEDWKGPSKSCPMSACGWKYWMTRWTPPLPETDDYL